MSAALLGRDNRFFTNDIAGDFALILAQILFEKDNLVHKKVYGNLFNHLAKSDLTYCYKQCP